MPSNESHEAHDYAERIRERIRERLPRRLQELREAVDLSMYALWMKCRQPPDIYESEWGVRPARLLAILSP